MTRVVIIYRVGIAITDTKMIEEFGKGIQGKLNLIEIKHLPLLTLLTPKRLPINSGMESERIRKNFSKLNCE